MIIKCINWIAVAVASVSLLASCEDRKSDEGQEEKTPEITVTPSIPDKISFIGGSITLSVKSNRDWTVSGIPQWLTVEPKSGSASFYKQNVTVSAGEHSGGLREAVLTFSNEDAAQDVTIVQNHSFGAQAPANSIYFESFKNGSGDFTIEDVKVPDEMDFVWEHSSQYSCMKGTAFDNPSNYESESWLVSPLIDLSGYDSAYLTFEHAGGYFGTPSEEATLWISEEGGDWEQLVIDKSDYPTSWTFIPAGNWDLAPYLGGKMKIAFRYSSTSDKAGTWEIRNVAVLSGTYKDVEVPAIDPTSTAWMELPATDDPDLGYYAHRFSIKDAVYRNYTFAWSQKDLVSVWVAYPLCSEYTRKVVDRTDAWKYDPILGKELSSAPFSRYAGDYARGHQLPSADRLFNKEANKQTFYGTNIAPQLNEHNEGIWSNLEGYVRDIAEASDTTYVVTGCVVEGSDEFTTDSDGKKMTVPVAFFKALLRYEKGADMEWSGAAFYTLHKNYGSAEDDLKAVSMSIDKLEEKTGIDFFVNLVDKIGKDAADAVEAGDPSENAVWGL